MNQIQRFFGKIKGFFPSSLPLTPEEFDVFAEDILKTYSLPEFASHKNTIAMRIMHLDVLETSKPKRHFAKIVKKAISNHAAYMRALDFKKQEQDDLKEMKDKEAALEGVNPEPLKSV